MDDNSPPDNIFLQHHSLHDTTHDAMHDVAHDTTHDRPLAASLSVHLFGKCFGNSLAGLSTPDIGELGQVFGLLSHISGELNITFTLQMISSLRMIAVAIMAGSIFTL